MQSIDVVACRDVDFNDNLMTDLVHTSIYIPCIFDIFTPIFYYTIHSYATEE